MDEILVKAGLEVMPKADIEWEKFERVKKGAALLSIVCLLEIAFRTWRLYITLIKNFVPFSKVVYLFQGVCTF